MPKVTTIEVRQQGERFLRLLDAALADSQTDKRWAAIARTQIEQAVMAACHALAPAPREPLPEDAPGYQEPCRCDSTENLIEQLHQRELSAIAERRMQGHPREESCLIPGQPPTGDQHD